MYSQYETTVINRRRLHELLAWVNRKYHELLSNVVYGILKRRPVFDRQFA